MMTRSLTYSPARRLRRECSSRVDAPIHLYIHEEGKKPGADRCRPWRPSGSATVRPHSQRPQDRTALLRTRIEGMLHTLCAAAARRRGGSGFWNTIIGTSQLHGEAGLTLLRVPSGRPPLGPSNLHRTTSIWRLLRAWLNRRRVQLGFAVRVTFAATLSLAVAQFAGLNLPLWAVLTAVVVTQVSVGGSLKATIDYLLGTLGGAVYGGALAVLVPHPTQWTTLAVLAVAVAPLALIAAINPRLRVAPVTAIIVLLVPTITHATPIASAIDRVLEVAVGGITGFLVSILLLPSRAHGQAIQTAARTLDAMARALRALLSGLSQGLDAETLHRIQDGIGQSLVRLSVISAEAADERAARIAADPDTAPLLRTLLRLRHDLVMIGRASQLPPPEALLPRLRPPVEHAGAAIADYLSAVGEALRARRRPPPRDAVEATLDAYTAEINELRSEGLTRSLSAEAAERFFALGFAFEQMRQNLQDLERCARECADQGQPR